MRFELTTSSLPRKCSTPELQQQFSVGLGASAGVKYTYLTSILTLKLIGAADEIRTRDIQLGRLTLYQLSYHRDIQK